MPHKLLLADDSITIQRVIELTFADEDVHVRTVGDGKSAIASIQSERPDIVLADVGMPERDGYEVAEFIKGNPQLASIPVLLLTGAFEPIDESRARAVGCDGVLVKPFEPQMVINRVKDLLAGRRSGGLWGNKTAPAPAPQEAVPAAPPPKDANAQPGAPVTAAATSASLEDYFDRLDAAFASVEAATEGHGVATDATRSPNVRATVDVGGPASSGLAKHDLEGWDPDLTGDPIKPAVPPPAAVVPALPSPPAAVPVQPAPASAAAASSPPAAIPFKPVAHAPSEVQKSAPEVAPPSPPPPAAIPFAAPAPAPAPVPVEAPPAAASAPVPMVERREPRPATVAPSPTSIEPPASTPPIAVAHTSLPSLADAFAALLSAEQGRSISASKVGAPNVSDQAIEDIVNRVIARMTDQSVRETVVDVAERLVREEIERIKAGPR